ncbi:hypothetical protein GOP47_0000406 [Adiantum capillus-veneris]|uniref:Uncharacterized protein n=1 Tax=Adiantum capillus-veneris TaxID=13818 RepID=A0A9D4VF32_ADICA|nr:hypothetical protein GOP47_0000406 [Adiantum capillus-veneris]
MTIGALIGVGEIRVGSDIEEMMSIIPLNVLTENQIVIQGPRRTHGLENGMIQMRKNLPSVNIHMSLDVLWARKQTGEISLCRHIDLVEDDGQAKMGLMKGKVNQMLKLRELFGGRFATLTHATMFLPS